MSNGGVYVEPQDCLESVSWSLFVGATFRALLLQVLDNLNLDMSRSDDDGIEFAKAEGLLKIYKNSGKSEDDVTVIYKPFICWYNYLIKPRLENIKGKEYQCSATFKEHWVQWQHNKGNPGT